MYKKIDIFVYSGTGNTFKVAQTICEEASSKGIENNIYMIDVHSKPAQYILDKACLLGLMAPTIGTIQPLSFFRFILNLPKGKDTNVFLAATGAWTKVGPFLIPGYIGFGLYIAALILIIKGYRVVGIDGFGMPHNWTTLIPPYRKKLETRIYTELKQSVKDFALKVLSGKRVYKRIGDLIIAIIMFPLPLLFVMMGHFFLTKSMFASYRCNGCGLCARNCPRQAIHMKGIKRKVPYWTFKCEQCMRCAGFCPQKAVESSYILIAVYCALFFSFSIQKSLSFIHKDIVDLGFLKDNMFLGIIISYAYILIILFITYNLFYYLNRIPLVNKFFTYTTLTFYWRKYREPSVEITDLGLNNKKTSDICDDIIFEMKE